MGLLCDKTRDQNKAIYIPLKDTFIAFSMYELAYFNNYK